VFIHYLLVTLDSYVEGEIVGLGVSVGSVINLCFASSLLYQKQKAKTTIIFLWNRLGKIESFFTYLAFL
jgi:hypothetical protein